MSTLALWRDQLTQFFNQVLLFIKPRWYFGLFLIPYLLFVMVTYRQYGVAIDEPIEYRFGEMLYARNFGRDPQLLHDFAVPGKDSREIWAYNHFHTMLLYIFNDNRSIEVYHGLNLLFATLAFWAVYELCLAASRRPGLSLVGPFFLFFTPRFLGDLAANVKDPVFAAYYLAGLLAIVWSSRTKHKLLPLVFLGVVIGLAAADRILGYSLLLVFSATRWLKLAGLPRQSRLWRLFGETACLGLIALAIHAIQMPFVAYGPVKSLPTLLAMARAYPWSGKMLYQGQLVAAGQLPWHYLPVWLLVTTPVVVLLLWVVSHALIGKNTAVTMLHGAFYLNFGLYFLFKPIIYDGLRHYLFLVVIIAALAAITWLRLWSGWRRLGRLGLVLLLILSWGGTVGQYYQLHPYEYIYFNEVTGFLPGAAGRFETDYWGTSYREAVLNLTEFLPNDQPRRVGLCGNQEAKIYFTNTPHAVSWWPNCEAIDPQVVDYIIANGRGGDWHRVPGKTLFAVQREGVPLVKVFQLLE